MIVGLCIAAVSLTAVIVGVLLLRRRWWRESEHPSFFRDSDRDTYE